jgi:acyl carrier protein
MEQFANYSAASSDPSFAGGEAERVMLEIWKDEIWIDEVGLDDDFFALGGDSLAAVRIMMRVKDAFGIDLPISQLLETPVLRNFAVKVAGLSESAESGDRSPPDMEEGIV